MERFGEGPPAGERKRVEQGGTTVLDQFKAGRNLTDALNALTDLEEYERDAVAVYLAQKEGTKELAGTNWGELIQKEGSIAEIRVGTLEAGKMTLGPPLIHSLLKIADVRVAPTGTAIAFTAEGHKNGQLELSVVPADGSAGSQLAAETRLLVPIGRLTAVHFCISTPPVSWRRTINSAWPR